MIHDISWPISNRMTAYKNRSSVQITPIKYFESDRVRESMITMGSHTGTHVDAPAHFLEDGGALEQVDLSSMIGVCRVLDCTDVAEVITGDYLEKFHMERGERILLKTKNSSRTADDLFHEKFIYLDQSAAAYCVAAAIQLIGIDYLGIERQQPAHETHIILFEHHITILEGLRLGNIVAGSYQLCCLPLSIPGIEAAPARAVLIAH